MAGMCDHAWVLLSSRVRGTARAERVAYLFAGERPPDAEDLVEEFLSALADAPESESMAPEMRRLRRFLGV